MSPELTLRRPALEDTPTIVPGAPHPLISTTPLALHDTADVWLVLHGAVNVFVAPLYPDGAEGPREFLYRIEAHTPLIGLGPTGDVGLPWRLRVLAVAETDTAVAPIAREVFDRAVQERLPQALILLARYGQAVRPVVTPTMPSTSLPARPDETMPDASELDASVLASWHAAVCRGAVDRVQRAEAAYRDRLDARHRADRDIAIEAHAAIATVLLPEGAMRLRDDTARRVAPPDTAVYAALHQIGALMGITFRQPLHVPAHGTVPALARIVARHSAVGYRQVELAADWWRSDAGPLLAFTRRATDVTGSAVPDAPAPQRPIVLVPIAGGYEGHDTTTGERRRVDAAFAATLAPAALQFYRSFSDAPVRAMDLLRFVATGARRDLRALTGAAMAVGMLALLVPLLTRTVFDHVVPAADHGALFTVLCALVVAAVAGMLFEWVRAVSLLRLRVHVLHDLQLALLDRLVRLPIGFFRQHAAGDLGRRASAPSAIGPTIGQDALSAVLGSVAAFCALVLLVWYSVPLALLSVGTVLVHLALLTMVARRALPLARLRHQASGELSARLIETFRGMAKLRVASAEPRLLMQWAHMFRDQQYAAFAFGMQAAQLTALLSVLDVLARLVTFGAYARLAEAGQAPLSAGAFVAFAAADGTLRTALLSLSSMLMVLLEQWPAWERTAPILQTVPESRTDRPDPGTLQGHIRLDHVSFRFDDSGPDILHDLSLDIPAGRFVAIVGPSGSGKSTLLRLLLGFERPHRGHIHYDGQDLRHVDPVAVRRQIGVVLQNATLSLGDIYSNITGSTPRPVADVWEAARLAGIDDELRAMPMQLQTIIPDGGSVLSGGQRQRLLIARALVSRPRMLFLDEATSALDTRAQRRVSESIAALRVTRVVVAHRLSTVRHADHIVVLDRGRLVESGTYESLMEHNGLFARLAAQQAP